MPNQLVIPVSAGTLPPGSCPSTGDYQGLLNLIASALTVNFPTTFTGITTSHTKPTDQSQIWLQLDSTGRPSRLYKYASGAWLSLHSLPPNFVMIWPFTLPDFTTFDGGDGNSLTSTSGPMWQTAKDAAGNPILAAQFPLGAGTLPSGSIVSVGGYGGEETHSLSMTEMPNHYHGLDTAGTNAGAGSSYLANGTLGYGNLRQTESAGGDTTKTGNPVVPHNNMPPYYGVYFLQRTSRLFYAVT